MSSEVNQPGAPGRQLVQLRAVNKYEPVQELGFVNLNII